MTITIGEVQQEFFVAGIPETTKAVAITGAVLDEKNHDQSIEDARRIAACWNVCDGLDTDYIEYAARTNNFVGHVQWLISERDSLKTELANSQERRRHQGEEIGKLHSKVDRLEAEAVKSSEAHNLISSRFAEMQAENAELLAALEALMGNDCPLTGNPTHEELVEHWEYEDSVGRGEAKDRLVALRVIAKAKGGAA